MDDHNIGEDVEVTPIWKHNYEEHWQGEGRTVTIIPHYKKWMITTLAKT
jgi:hypothetical protein